MTALTSRSQTVNVGQQLGLGDSWVSHQADVYVALRRGRGAKTGSCCSFRTDFFISKQFALRNV